MQQVYIIHLHTPLKHAQHYVGFSRRLSARLAHHKAGTGANFLRVCNELGIQYDVVVTMKGDRALERKLKNTKNVKVYCPICSGDKVRKYHPKGDKDNG